MINGFWISSFILKRLTTKEHFDVDSFLIVNLVFIPQNCVSPFLINCYETYFSVITITSRKGFSPDFLI